MKWMEPNAFDWEESPPLSSFRAVATGSLVYVAAVIGSTILSKRYLPVVDKTSSSKEETSTMTGLQWKPWFGSDLQTAQFIHNIVLVASSAIMLCGVVVESIKRLSMPSESSWPPFLLCEETKGIMAGKGALYYWSYIYYLSKYYELLDTALQLARGKPPPHFALHVYHHSVVLFMAWAWCEYHQSLHFIGLAFNTAVHVVMYTYFLQRTITKATPKWKSLVTLFQIVQFSFSFFCAILTIYISFVQGYQCAGMSALGLNALFNVTLLHSFVGVFKKGGKKKRKTV
ncbi:Putative elongation of fatty acids protein DDB_G0272012 [Seminavis robusta]|uniref:Elongation of fatty acids protein n=1 Tax=Seminavis robusta TaxID=568900 RepID=A0A9N8DW10_9STRA|nr:Putative elongation of fatty acids protein DDB_G0272012 [Seminavis robusta]|eukprot:Sro405_g136100.1 Putative elongation of fatty acids protein DDB_G0272012 (286) ;mRNA; f:24894-25751